MRMLISYDIASQRRRRRVVHLLEGHGHRVQESVFICLLYTSSPRASLSPESDLPRWHPIPGSSCSG